MTCEKDKVAGCNLECDDLMGLGDTSLNSSNQHTVHLDIVPLYAGLLFTSENLPVPLYLGIIYYLMMREATIALSRLFSISHQFVLFWTELLVDCRRYIIYGD